MAKPKLRFHEFTDEWKEKKLSEIFEFTNGKAHEQSIDENGKYIIVNSKFISTDGKVKKYTNDLICPLKKNDIVMVMSDVPNGRAMSKCFLIQEDDKYTLNQRICGLRTNQNSFFYIHQISRNKYYLKFDNGVSQTNLRKEDVINCPIFETTTREQQKIANFLSSVDDIIQIQEDGISTLEEQKKGAMQKLFNREVRFRVDDGSEYPEWEEKRIDEVCQIVGGGTPSTSNAEFWNGNIQWFTPTEVGKSKYVYTSKRTITEKGVQESSAKLLPKGTILLSTRATIGEMSIAGQECCTNQGFQSLIVNENCSNEYIYYLQDTIKAYALKNSSGSTFLEISKNNLGKCILPIPCIKEQEKIVGCLSAYDEVIQIKKEKLEVWKEIKKGLLQQMFV